MTSYLLLRNNKESGPFSLNELVSHGLKAYDLIWVNGKSAAWRYPGEIPELKEFAPAVEEQPYDRFYKKPAAARKEEAPVREQEPSVAGKTSSNQAVQQEQPVFVPKKSVFVTLPGQKQQQPVRKEESRPAEYERYQPAPQQETRQEEETVAAAPTISIRENPVTAEIKYSQPLDEIKEMYVKTLQQRKQRLANKALLLQTARKAAVVIAIVGAGVLIGFSIKSKDNTPQVIAGESLAQPLQAPVQETETPGTPEAPATEQAENGQIQEITGNSKSLLQEAPVITSTHRRPVQEPITSPQAEEESPEPLQKKEYSLPEKNQVTGDEISPGAEINARTGERGRKVRENAENNPGELQEPEKETRNIPKAVMNPKSLSRLVSVKSNDYKIVAFGGIRDLQLTVSNDSKYILDNVTVELQYLRPSEEPLKTEYVQFRSVSPGGSLTIRVPDTNRGVKVAYKITHILSTQSAREMADL